MTTRNPHLHAVILAGGSGQRFWPLSRELNPKQLLSMFGIESLVAVAIHRSVARRSRLNRRHDRLN